MYRQQKLGSKRQRRRERKETSVFSERKHRGREKLRRCGRKETGAERGVDKWRSVVFI